MKAIRLEHFSLSTLFPLSLTIIPLSPKRILKKESLFPHRKLPLLRFPSSTTNKSKRPLPNHHPYYKFPSVYLSNFDNSLSLSLFQTSTYKIHRKESQTSPKVPLTPNSTLTPFQSSREQLLNRSNPNQTFLAHPLNRSTRFARHKNGFLHLFIFDTREE